MLEYLQKQRTAAQGQGVGPEHMAQPTGAGNQAMLSMLVGQREQPARAASGGQPLGDAMRAKFERQFGLPMDQVRVHRNSDEPAKFDAKAYAYGSDIFLGPGYEDSLEHEVTHVVQQMMGLVRPTGMENGMAVNDAPALEHSAEMGVVPQTMGMAAGPVVQCDKKHREDEENFKHWKSKIDELIAAKTRLDDSGISQGEKDSAQKLWDDHGNMHQQVEDVMRARRLFTQENYAGGSFSYTESLVDRLASAVVRGRSVFDELQRASTSELMMGSLYFGGSNHYEPSREGATEREIETGTEGGRLRFLHWLGPRLEFSDKVFRCNMQDGYQTFLVEYLRGKVDYDDYDDDDDGEGLVHRSRGALLKKGGEKMTDKKIQKLVDMVAYAQYELAQNPGDTWEIIEDAMDDDGEAAKRISHANSFLEHYMKKHRLLSSFGLQPADPDEAHDHKKKRKNKKACVIQ